MPLINFLENKKQGSAQNLYMEHFFLLVGTLSRDENIKTNRNMCRVFKIKIQNLKNLDHTFTYHR